MGLIERARRLRRAKPATATPDDGSAPRRFPWVAVGLGAGAILGLLGLVLGTAWVLGPGEGSNQRHSQIISAIPLAQPARPASETAPAARPAGDPAAEASVRPGLGLGVPAMPANAFDAVPPAAVVEPLSEAPAVELLEPVNGQMLPRIGADGRRSWQAYARPFDKKDDRPRVALIIGGLGLSRPATEASIERLPGAVTLAFDPYAEETALWTRRARRSGHETLATLPLQSADFPFRDMGPQTLQVAAPLAANMQRLADILARAPGALGFLAVGGSEFSRSAEAAIPILKAIKGRGLMLVDATPLAGASLVTLAAKLDVPHLHVDVMLDDTPDAAAIDQQLQQLAQLARERLVGVGLGRPLPVTFARIQVWAGKAEAAGVVLAPASAIVGSQFTSP